ncbi:hypothetical protein CL657_02960 [bacterium]|nr:hypothetical protein [bacterium]
MQHSIFELIAVGDKITIVPVISLGEISYTTEAICCTDIGHRDRNKVGYLITKPIESSQILTRDGEGFDCDEFKKSLTNCKSHSLSKVLTFIEKLSRSNDILGSIMNQLLQRFDDPNSKELCFRFRKTEILQIDRMLEFSSKQ